MATRPIHPVIRHVRRAVLLRDGAGMTDGQLLESFITSKDEVAFEALVRRHGPMVLAVCRRILGNEQDSEDAFQATFLVLIRKAASVVPRALVGNWLYGVARMTARRAKVAAAKRAAREKQVKALPEPGVVQGNTLDKDDLRLVLDQELSRLPEKYRIPILLCDLQNKSIKHAARSLGWPQGTLAGRLARARTMLAKRLTRRGLLPLGGSLAVVLSENAASASVPTLLVISTVRTAALVATGQAMSAGIMTARVTVLMEGVLKTMLLNKLKTAMLFLLAAGVVGVGLGVSGSFYPTHAAEEKTAPVPVASDKSQANALEQQPTPRSALTGPRRSTGKQYLMQIQVFESAAAGGVRAASPCHRHAVREGEAESIILVGKTMPHDFGERNQENATIYEAVMAGISYVVKLRELSAGHLLLDLCLKKEDVEHHQKEKDGILIWGRTLQLLRKTEIGKLERFVLEKDNKGQPSSWVELVIIRDSDDHHTLLNHSGPLPFSDDRPNSPEKHSLKTELEGVWRPVRMEVSWFSLNWKIARFELASKG